MTNTQQTILEEVSASEQPQEEVQLTELRPVEHSRIKKSKNDQENTTDGLKALRSISEETGEDLNEENFELIPATNAKTKSTSKTKRKRGKARKSTEPNGNIDDQEGTEDHDVGRMTTRRSQRVKCSKIIPCGSSSSESVSHSEWSESEMEEDDDNDIVKKKKKKIIPIKSPKKKSKRYFKDEVYNYRQTEDDDSVRNNVFKDMANNFSNTSSPSKSPKNFKPKIKTSDKSTTKSVSTDAPSEEEIRLKIGEIIQSNYRKEQENNNQEDVNQMEEDEEDVDDPPNPSQSSENSELAELPNKMSKDQMTCTSEDQMEEKKFVCIICDAKFKGSGGLRNHWKVMHMEGPLFKCDDCGKEFPLKERLKLHVRTHTGFKPYKCPECDKSFARGGQLAQHRRTHSHVKPYHCTLCTGSFTCAANLALHIKRHNGQKDHKCEICGREFIRRDALKKHLDCLHKDVKSFLCVICNKTFKGHLPQHMRTHCQDKPHGCATCGQRFAQKSQLTVHQRTHSGQRPFRCLVCWQAFAHSTALKLHTRRHTGERPFKCAMCSAGFTQLPHWKKHMKCIHGRSKPYSCKHCNKSYKMKNDLESHEKICVDENPGNNIDYLKGADPNAFKAMSVEKMRLLLAVLLKRISKPEKLDELGFGKRLIDEIIQDSLETAGKEPAKIGEFTELEALRKNLEMFLEWTVPKEHWEAFKKMNKNAEEILETLTAT